jgi:hypothetical protein
MVHFRAVWVRLVVLVLASIGSAMALCTPASAALIAQDWHQSNDGLITRDSDTGLQWIDVSVTRGLSWNAVQSALAPGGVFAGFRGPTDAEVVKFWADARIPDVETTASFRPTAANLSPIITLQGLWGETDTIPLGPAGVLSTWVTTAESFDPVDGRVESSALLRRFDSDGTAAAQLRVLLGVRPDNASPTFAHALVRPVPEPSAPILSVIVIVTAMHRRRGRSTR